MSENIFDMTALADELEDYIRLVIPESETVKKYGGTLFTLKPEEKEGQFCGVFIYTKHVQISFSKGAMLKDPHDLLLGSGKYRRHLKFLSSDSIDFKKLEKLLKQASKL